MKPFLYIPDFKTLFPNVSEENAEIISLLRKAEDKVKTYTQKNQFCISKHGCNNLALEEKGNFNPNIGILPTVSAPLQVWNVVLDGSIENTLLFVGNKIVSLYNTAQSLNDFLIFESEIPLNFCLAPKNIRKAGLLALKWLYIYEKNIINKTNTACNTGNITCGSLDNTTCNNNDTSFENSKDFPYFTQLLQPFVCNGAKIQ